MKLGAQLFSVRTLLQTPEDIRATFQKIKEIGYDVVQFSGAGPIDARELKEISDSTGLPIVCSHTAPARILNDTDAVIAEHKIFGCPVIGIGSMPVEYHSDPCGNFEAFLERFSEPVKKIRAAGLRFAYHNHAFEFQNKFEDGSSCYDRLLERCPDWSFILDTYWVEFAGCSAADYIRKVGTDRLQNIHFKDMTRDTRDICACGDGVLDFASLYEVCREIGVENVLVEQDNAVDLADPLEGMRRSFTHLRPIVK